MPNSKQMETAEPQVGITALMTMKYGNRFQQMRLPIMLGPAQGIPKV